MKQKNFQGGSLRGVTAHPRPHEPLALIDLSSLYTQKKLINELIMEIAGPSSNIRPMLSN